MHGDLLDLISLSKIIQNTKFDEIYNFADQDHVKWSFEIPSYSFFGDWSNGDKFARNNKKLFTTIQFSNLFSSNIFGDSKNKSQNEKEKFSPRSIYAIGKVTAFHACELYKKIFNLKIYGAIL